MTKVYQTQHNAVPIQALRHFKKVDPALYVLVKKYEKTITIPVAISHKKYFSVLCSSIISQQLSTRAAETIEARVKKVIPQLTAKNIMGTDAILLREAGVSMQKINYLHSLATHWPQLHVTEFTNLSDEEIINRLITVHGIGKWTAEMFLMFAMSRPDIFSYNDLILRQQICRLHGLHPKTDSAKAESIAATWSPYRSIASYALWKNKDVKTAD